MAEAVLICGSRDWSDEGPIRAFIQVLEPESLVVHGNARGADRIAEWIAVQEGHHVAAVPALWDRYGRSAAGPRRNRAMTLLAPALSRAAAFPLPGSKGTWGMVRLLVDADVPVFVWDGERLTSHHPGGQGL